MTARKAPSPRAKTKQAAGHDRSSGREAELQQLVHELEVHQEELRTQQTELLASQRALEEARDRYEELFDFAPIGYIVIDAHGVIHDANVSASRLLGIERSRLLGKTVTRLVADEDRPVMMAHLVQCRAGEERVETELCLRQAAGTSLTVQLISSQAHFADGPERYHTAIVDLSELRRSEADRTRALVEQQRLVQEEQVARAASDAKDRFIAVLSHELRTPLAPILFALDVAHTRQRVPEGLRPTLDMIRRNVLLETRLIDDLLDMTRIVQGKMSHLREVIDVHEAITDVLALCQEQLQGASAEVMVALDATAHTVQADPVRLRQVIWNLLNNALRNTPAGGLVEIRTDDREPGFVRLVVRDNGRGIDPALLPRIFTFFEQDDDSRRRGTGLGLGLPISKAIVESHGGRISAESGGPGTGATFTVTLRTVAEELLPIPLSIVGDEAGHPSFTILLVEDDEDSAAAIAEFLELHGYVVKTAPTVRAALDLYVRGDVLVSDISLPDGTGYDVMRGVSRTGPVSGIALSGFGAPEDIRRSLEAGFARHIVKPVLPSELLTAISEVAAPPPEAHSSRRGGLAQR